MISPGKILPIPIHKVHTSNVRTREHINFYLERSCNSEVFEVRVRVKFRVRVRARDREVGVGVDNFSRKRRFHGSNPIESGVGLGLGGGVS